MLEALGELFRAGGPVMYCIALASLVAWWMALASLVGTRRLLTELEAARASSEAEPHRAAAASAPARAGLFAADTARVGQWLQLLAVFVGVLPLLGLLGTVFGMIGTFGLIQAEGVGDPRLLAGGIRQALVATETGLATAIPVLFFHQVITARLRRVEGLQEALRLALARRSTEAHALDAGGRP